MKLVGLEHVNTEVAGHSEDDCLPKKLVELADGLYKQILWVNM